MGGDDKVTAIGAVKQGDNVAANCTPRRLFLELVRDIDAGEIDITRCIVITEHRKGEDHYQRTFSAGPLRTVESIGLLEMAKHDLLHDDETG